MTERPRHDAPLDIRHEAAAGRFVALVDGLECVVLYRLDGSVMRIHHTEVPAALEGRGIAGKLVAATLGHARAQGLKVAPYCSYVRSYMRRHPETQSLLAPGQSV